MRRSFGVVSVALAATCALAQTSDIDTVRQRRLSNIVGSSTGSANIALWISTLQANGTWPDVDYTTGCPASASSWPAQEHWERINTFASAWHGGFKNALNWTGDATVRASAASAMAFWFENDFNNTDPACLDSGGLAACPCGTPGLWNTNWFENVILIPTWVGQVCNTLNAPPTGQTGLSASEYAGCTLMTYRSFNTLNTGIVGVSSITGANLLDIASIGIDYGLFTSNATAVSAGYAAVHGDLQFQNAVEADGIRADGAFGQHEGLLYNGGYGKDYANAVFNLEICAGGTQFEATSSAMSTFTTLLTSDLWMIFYNTITNVLHWDYTVIGRNLAEPVSQKQEAANTELNITQFQVLGELWNSDNITSVFNALNSAGSSVTPGNLVGNRMFYTNDYMVHRSDDYLITLKMFSKRTKNSECVNSQNMLGFHLADGAVYTYTTGNEYQDVFSAWDWNLIPGITVDYGETPLSCSKTQVTGIQAYVGGVSDGTTGMAVMRYENPTTHALNWRKAYIFLPDDIMYVMIPVITSTTTAPVFSVLDQRVQDGDVYVNGVAATTGNFTGASSLWHAGTGYTFNTSNPATSLSLELQQKTGDWQAIGTSTAAPNTVDMFTAWIAHNDITKPATYAMYPAISESDFATKAAAESTNYKVIRSDDDITALLDIPHNTIYVGFWTTAGSTLTVPAQKSGGASIQIKANANSALILHMDTWTVWVSDPTQTINATTPLVLTFTLLSGTAPAGWGSAKSRVVNVTLPQGGQGGMSTQWALP
uniref:Polysaccharide lyase family 8 protein n=1 Tax=Mycena chlorophos TaxID=658473 RepID=A0ABQ0M0Z1_MYCCL|nr:polysaccharide lyase family 8 protein [Mycena chlorophos]